MRKAVAAIILAAWVISCAAQDGAGAKAPPKDAKPDATASGAAAAEPLPNLYVRVNLKDGETSKVLDAVSNGVKPLKIMEPHPSAIAGYSVFAEFSLEFSKTQNGLALSYRADLKTPIKTEPRQAAKTEQPQTPAGEAKVAYQSTGPSGTVNVKIGEPMMLFNSGERVITVTVFDKPWPAK